MTSSCRAAGQMLNLLHTLWVCQKALIPVVRPLAVPWVAIIMFVFLLRVIYCVFLSARSKPSASNRITLKPLPEICEQSHTHFHVIWTNSCSLVVPVNGSVRFGLCGHSRVGQCKSGKLSFSHLTPLWTDVFIFLVSPRAKLKIEEQKLSLIVSVNVRWFPYERDSCSTSPCRNVCVKTGLKVEKTRHAGFCFLNCILSLNLYL